MKLSFIINLQKTDPARWKQAMQGLKKIVSRFPVPLMRLEETVRLGCKQQVWKKEVVARTSGAENIQLIGDYYTKQHGAIFQLYTDRGEQMKQKREVNYSQRVFHLSPDDEHFSSLPGYDGFNLFRNSDTTGFTYTYAVLAMGIYLEHCFYETAYLAGTYNPEQINLVTEWLESLFGQPVSLPKTIVQPALWEKLQPEYTDVQHTITRFWLLSRCSAKDKIAFLLEQHGPATDTFLTGQLKQYPSVHQWGAKDLLVPCLLACNDLEKFLQFFRRMQPALNKEGFTLTELLKLLIGEGICDKPFHNEMLKEFHKERASLQTENESLYRMLFQLSGMPNIIDFYAHPDELLELFAYYEPQQGKAFKKILDEKVREINKKRSAFNQKLEETVDKAMDKVEAEMEAGEYDPVFTRHGLANEDYFIQSAIADKRKNLNFEDTAREFCNSIRRALQKYSEAAGLERFTRSSAKEYLQAIYRQIPQCGLILSEDAWQALDRQTDKTILQALLYVVNVSSRETNYLGIRNQFFESPEYWLFLKEG